MEISRNKPATRKSTVVAGSVSESRMRVDQVRGGVKVFNGEPRSSESADQTESHPSTPTKRLTRAEAASAAAATTARKRKTWRSESFERSPGGREGSEFRNGSLEGSRKSPAELKKTRSNPASDRSSMQLMKTRSGSEVVEGGGTNNSPQLRKTKSHSDRVKGELDAVGQEGNSALSSKLKLAFDRVGDSSGKEIDGSGDGTGEDLIQLKTSSESISVQVKPGSNSIGSIPTRPGETEESRFGAVSGVVLAAEEMIASDLGNVGPVNYSLQLEIHNHDADGADGDGDGLLDNVNGDDEVDDDSEDEEIKVDNDDDDDDDDSEDEELDEEIEVGKGCLDMKEEMNVVVEEKCKKEIIDVNKFEHHTNLQSNPCIPPLVGKQLPQLKNKTANCTGNFSRPTPNPIGVSDECCQRSPETQSKLQTLVDLIMWRDASRSAFVFGLGAFFIVSSSYTKEINFSLISVISYLALIYLATTFLYRSILCRGVVDVEDPISSNYLGEEEAIWLLRLLLPYVNEFLLKIRGLFSGDPAMTMKVAVVLFVLARCGNSITIWKMVKLGFFGVFSLPKFYSSYSAHITAYGKFWIRRFGDAWQSCTHKKAAGFAIFTLFWNLSSVVARIWAAFMLFVAFRFYQQSMASGEDWAVDDAEAVLWSDNSKQSHQQLGRRRTTPSQVIRRPHNSIDLIIHKKEKKRSLI
ncbi:hypothetical protein Dimus_034256 [Dionaea muscipula]